MWRYLNAGSLKPRIPLYPFCTKSSIIFLGSPSLKLPFDMIIALVQTRYHGDRKPENSEFCIVGTIWRYLNACSLKPRKPLYPYCTKSRIKFLGSPSLNLPFDMIIALVQTRYHGDRKPEHSEFCIVETTSRYLNAGSLKPCKSLYPYCTKSRIIFLGSPSLKLPFDIITSLVQTWYHVDRKPRTFGILHCRHYVAILECG